MIQAQHELQYFDVYFIPEPQSAQRGCRLLRVRLMQSYAIATFNKLMSVFFNWAVQFLRNISQMICCVFNWCIYLRATALFRLFSDRKAACTSLYGCLHIVIANLSNHFPVTIPNFLYITCAHGPSKNRLNTQFDLSDLRLLPFNPWSSAIFEAILFRTAHIFRQQNFLT